MRQVPGEIEASLLGERLWIRLRWSRILRIAVTPTYAAAKRTLPPRLRLRHNSTCNRTNAPSLVFCTITVHEMRPNSYVYNERFPFSRCSFTSSYRVEARTCCYPGRSLNRARFIYVCVCTYLYGGSLSKKDSNPT